MQNPYKPETIDWYEWEIRNSRLLREEKLLKDMTKYISEKILFISKIIYINENQLEVKIYLNDLAKEYDTIYLDIDIKEFFDWREKLMPNYNYKKICEEFEKYVKTVTDTYKNCPELEKYILRSKEYKKISEIFKEIKQDYIKEQK